jgi:hypothetical protein
MKLRYRAQPNLGDTREVRAFLWLPKRINGETRWLERAVWEESYIRLLMSDWVFIGWRANRWLD